MSSSLEDLRPRRLADVVGQEKAVSVVRSYVVSAKNGGFFPHLLLTGPAGTGKTSLAMATAREVLGLAFNANFKEVNASDERKIDDIRDLKQWIELSPIDAPFKMILLDEVDSMLEPAQNALRRIMEAGTETTRFILAANKPGRIIAPIQSRCSVLRFKPLSKEELTTIVQRAAGPNPDARRVESSVGFSRGDARRAIHLYFEGGGELDQLQRLEAEVKRMFEGSGDALARVEAFCAFVREEGLSDWEDVLRAVQDYAYNTPSLGVERRASLMYDAAVTAFRTTMVTTPIVQLRGFLASMVT